MKFLIIVFLVILSIFFIIFFSAIELEIRNLKLSTEKDKKRFLNREYKFIIKLKLLNKITYFKLNITKNLIEKIIANENVKKLELKIIENRRNFDLKSLKYIKKLKITLKKLKLDVRIGFQEAGNTAIATGMCNGVISILLRNFMEKENNNKFNILPIYQNRNILLVDFEGIFTLKVIHIIYVIYVVKKQKGGKYGTSNRRAYVYSNE